jgi:hypothetical protein
VKRKAEVDELAFLKWKVMDLWILLLLAIAGKCILHRIKVMVI